MTPDNQTLPVSEETRRLQMLLSQATPTGRAGSAEMLGHLIRLSERIDDLEHSLRTRERNAILEEAADQGEKP